MVRLNPVLTSPERVGHLILGAGLLAFAIWGTLDATWLRILVGALGVIFLIGGIGGT